MPRLSTALTASVTEMEDIQTQISLAYTNGVVDGFSEEFLDSVCFGIKKTVQYWCLFFNLTLSIDKTLDLPRAETKLKDLIQKASTRRGMFDWE